MNKTISRCDLDISLAVFGYKVNLTLLLILILAAFFRLWQLEERFIFSGETNNVLYTLSDLVFNRRSPLLGLEATGYIHHLFLTPWYLYLMAPFFIFSRGEPLIFAFIHSLLGIVSVFLLYKIGVLLSNKKLGYISALIYASSFITISIDRSVWSAGLIPFFTIVSIYLLLKSLSRNSRVYFTLLGISLGVGLSLHYQFALIIIGALTTIYIRNKRKIAYTVFPVAISMLPLFIFDLRHNFFNLQGALLTVQNIVSLNSPYSYQHYLYFAYPFVVLTLSYLLTKVRGNYLILLAIFYLTIQAKIFFSYNSSPNYYQRLMLTNQILKYYHNGLQIYFKNKDSYEYKYLLLKKAKDNNFEPSKIIIYEPWQGENTANIIVQSDKILLTK